MQTTTGNTDDLSLNHVSNRLYTQSTLVPITSKSKQLANHRNVSLVGLENKTNRKASSSNGFKVGRCCNYVAYLIYAFQEID